MLLRGRTNDKVLFCFVEVLLEMAHGDRAEYVCTKNFCPPGKLRKLIYHPSFTTL